MTTWNMVKYLLDWMIVVFVSVRVTNAFSHSAPLIHINALKTSCRTVRVISDIDISETTGSQERIHGRFELDIHFGSK